MMSKRWYGQVGCLFSPIGGRCIDILPPAALKVVGALKCTSLAFERQWKEEPGVSLAI
jgi:hypothetical protein